MAEPRLPCDSAALRSLLSQGSDQLLSVRAPADLWAKIPLPPKREHGFIRGLQPLDLSGSDVGQINSGVFRAQTSEGEKVLLKLQNVELSPTRLGMQQALARKGYSPRLYGMLDSEETDRLIEAFNLPTPLRSPEFRHTITGVLMEEIVGGWNTKGDLPPRVYAELWNYDEISRQMREIVEYLNEVGIDAGTDMQFLISPTGRPYLIDFDMYKVRSELELVQRRNQRSLERILSNLRIQIEASRKGL